MIKETFSWLPPLHREAAFPSCPSSKAKTDEKIGHIYVDIFRHLTYMSYTACGCVVFVATLQTFVHEICQ